MPISTLEGYPRIGGVIGYGPVGGSGVWKLQERYALADDFYDDVSLLLKMNGANGSTTFLDSSQFGHEVTANGDSEISTTQSKFGGSSLALDGTGDYLSMPGGNEFDLSSGDWTIEAWIYPTTLNAANIIFNLHGALNSSSGLNFYVTIIGELRQDNAASAAAASASGVISVNTWTHVAAVRTSGQTQLYVNGLASGSTSGQSPNSASYCTVGAQGNFFNPFTGYIDSVRITKGQARYTAAFTPPQRDFLP